jgi:hypothetical protein
LRHKSAFTTSAREQNAYCGRQAQAASDEEGAVIAAVGGADETGEGSRQRCADLMRSQDPAEDQAHFLGSKGLPG